MNPGSGVAGTIERLLESARIPGCSLAVIGRDGVVWSHGFGFADVASKRPVTESTVFHLFSGTKLFTATAILQLVEGNQLDLETSVSTYLPQLPLARDITLRALLSHASGLKETLRGFLAVYFAGEDPPTTEQALAGYDLRSRGSPSGKARYRNVNYAILGEVVSRVSGLPYRTFVRQRILSPLSSDAGFDVSDFNLDDLATGYIARWDPTRALLRLLDPSTSRRIYRGRTKDGLVALEHFNLVTSAIGGLVGSVSSFAPFIRSQLTDGSPLLSPKSVQSMQAMVARGRAGIESKVGVGLGWKIGLVGDCRFLNHEGGGAGFTSELRLYPDEGLGMVVLMNRSSMSGTMRVAHTICETIRGSWESFA
jgi:D-alanyl-D-alanine carboxypeptidase